MGRFVDSSSHRVRATRGLLIGFAGVVAVGAALGTAAPVRAREPAGPAQLLAQPVPIAVVERVGGFRVAGPDAGDPAAVYASSDGTLISVGPQIAIAPPPALANLRRRQLSQQAVVKLHALAREARLDEPPPRYGRPLVSDATTTVVSYRDERGRTFVHRAYALSVPRSFPLGTRAARSRLLRFVRALQSPVATFGAANVGRNEPYVAAAFELVARPAPAPRPGVVERRTEAWPLRAVRLGQSADCTPVTGPHAAALRDALARATRGTRWLQAGSRYLVSNRQTMPGEVPCR